MSKLSLIILGPLLIGALVIILNSKYNHTTTTYPETVTPNVSIVETVCELTCELEKRTLIIYERNRNLYMEQSRLEAIREMNLELTGLIYKSPYINQEELIMVTE